MQKSFVTKTQVYIQQANVYVRPGDLITYNPTVDNKVTVSRAGEVVTSFPAAQLGIDAMIKSGWLELVVAEEAAEVKAEVVKVAEEIKAVAEKVEPVAEKVVEKVEAVAEKVVEKVEAVAEEVKAEVVKLADMTKAQIVEHAAKLGLTLDINLKKDDLIAAVNAVPAPTA
jgi:prolyl oligopeptidase PreP (S9A serine peptidase family)